MKNIYSIKSPSTLYKQSHTEIRQYRPEALFLKYLLITHLVYTFTAKEKLGRLLAKKNKMSSKYNPTNSRLVSSGDISPCFHMTALLIEQLNVEYKYNPEALILFALLIM